MQAWRAEDVFKCVTGCLRAVKGKVFFFQEQVCDSPSPHCFSSHVSTLTACVNACSATVHASYHVRTDT